MTDEKILNQMTKNKVISDAIRNVVFMGIWTFVVIFLNNYLDWRIPALILGGIELVVTVFSVIPAVFGIILAFIASAKGFQDKDLMVGQIYRTIEDIICVFYIYLLYVNLF